MTLMADAFQAVMVPALDDIVEKIETKIDESAESVKKDLGRQIDSLDKNPMPKQVRLEST